jgi:hypothetical protein
MSQLLGAAGEAKDGFSPAAQGDSSDSDGATKQTQPASKRLLRGRVVLYLAIFAIAAGVDSRERPIRDCSEDRIGSPAGKRHGRKWKFCF